MFTGTAERPSFRHEALLYARPGEFLQCSTSFIRDALAADEPVLVVVNAAKISLLRSSLGDDADDVFFADMADVGLNPNRIIPAWRAFVAEHGVEGRGLRGIGEPIWPGRSQAELEECQRHESLLNLAFADTPPWWLLCPYDTAALAPEVIAEAHRNHPYVWHGDTRRYSGTYQEELGATSLDGPFPDPPADAATMTFGDIPLSAVRNFVSSRAAAHGLNAARTGDLVTAVNEIATNSVRHGGGQGVLRVWHEAEAVICEVNDDGHISQPLIGRELPEQHSRSGRGVWIANQLCDLVQLRSSARGTVIRLHARMG